MNLTQTLVISLGAMVITFLAYKGGYRAGHRCGYQDIARALREHVKVQKSPGVPPQMVEFLDHVILQIADSIEGVNK